jgi:hypothetical protein
MSARLSAATWVRSALSTSLVQALAIADSFNTALTENPTDAGTGSE